MAIKEILLVTLTFAASQMLVASAETRDTAQRSSEDASLITAATEQHVSQDGVAKRLVTQPLSNKVALANINVAREIAASVAAIEAKRVERRVSRVIYRNDGQFNQANTVKF